MFRGITSAYGERVIPVSKPPDSSTRRTILTLLKTKGSLSVNALSGMLGVTEMAVRRHLIGLEGDGYVEMRLQRQAMGRPTHMYQLTQAAEDFFPKNYHKLTLDLLSELEEESPELVDRLFERRKETLVGNYALQMEGKTLADKVALLAEIQNAGGYMVEWRQEESGGYVLNEYNCPIARIADRYEQACSCELMLFQRLLGVQVERTECLAKGGGKCTYKIASAT